MGTLFRVFQVVVIVTLLVLVSTSFSSAQIVLYDRYTTDVIDGDMLDVNAVHGDTLRTPFVVYMSQEEVVISVQPSTDVDIGTPGVHMLTFSVKDSTGVLLHQRSLTVNVVQQTTPFFFFDSYENDDSTALLNTISIPFQTTISSETYFLVDVFSYDPDGNDASNFLSVNYSSLDTEVVGNYHIEYQLAIPNQPVITMQRIVHVTDQIPPIISITFPQNMEFTFIDKKKTYIVEAGSMFIYPDVTAMDDYDENPTVSSPVESPSSLGESTFLTSGTVVTITYTATDSSMNKISRSVFVQVLDRTPPNVVLKGNASVIAEAGVGYADAGVAVTDILDDALGLPIVSQLIFNNVTIFPPSLADDHFAVQYQACDQAANCASSVFRIITFQDTLPPTITMRDDMSSPLLSITIGNKENKEKLTDVFSNSIEVADLYYARAEIEVTIDDSHVEYTQLASNLPHVTYIMVTAMDGSLNTIVKNVSVTIAADGTPPIITLDGKTAIELSNPSLRWKETGYSATDNVDGNLTSSVSVSISIANQQPTALSVTGNLGHVPLCPFSEVVGSSAIAAEKKTFLVPTSEMVDNDHAYSDLVYIISYFVMDTSGNVARKNRSVTFKDGSRPIITLASTTSSNLEVVTTEVHKMFVDKGATASDTFDGDLTGYLCAKVRVNLGTGHLPVSDAENRGLNVLNSLVLTGGSYTPISVEDMEMAIQNREYPVGTVLIFTYSVQDRAGHEANEKSRGYVVVDTTPPVFSLLGDGVVGDVDGADVFVIPYATEYREPGVSATDNYDSDADIAAAIVVDGASDVDTHSPGAFTITYSVNDSHDNIVTAHRRVRVEPNTFPPNDLIIVLRITGTPSDVYQGGNDIHVENDLRNFLDAPFAVLFSVSALVSRKSYHGHQRRRDGSMSSTTTTPATSTTPTGPITEVRFGVRNTSTLEWEDPASYIAFLKESASNNAQASIFSSNTHIISASVLGDATTTPAPSSKKSGGGIVAIAVACVILVIIVVLLLYAVLRIRVSNQSRNRGSRLLDGNSKDSHSHQHELSTVGGVRYVIDDSSDSDDDIPPPTEDELRREALEHTISDTNFALYNAEDSPVSQPQEAIVVKYGWDKRHHRHHQEDSDDEAEEGGTEKWMELLKSDDDNVGTSSA
eukprot:m.98288 g.98288  ORF g.98288 m.98288 type:complete len:1147 (+) comp9005_c3_seq1:77-3517(+)